MVSTRGHLEKTLAEAYRREADQEENLWRSLPFFAATIALALAAIFNMVGHVALDGWWRRAEFWIVVAAAAAMVATLALLCVSVFPAPFIYIAREPELLA